jgi:hypothetical protein
MTWLLVAVLWFVGSVLVALLLGRVLQHRERHPY